MNFICFRRNEKPKFLRGESGSSSFLLQVRESEGSAAASQERKVTRYLEGRELYGMWAWKERIPHGGNGLFLYSLSLSSSPFLFF